MRGHKTFKQLVTRSPAGAPSGQPALRSDEEERAENGPRPAPLFSYQEGAGHWRSHKCPQGDALRPSAPLRTGDAPSPAVQGQNRCIFASRERPLERHRTSP